MHAKSVFIKESCKKRKKKKKIPRFAESCPIVRKVGKFETEKSDTVERKNRAATGESTTLVVSICHHCGNARVHARLVTRWAARPTSSTISRIVTKWMAVETIRRETRATRNPVSEVGRHAGTAASCWRQLSALISFHFLALKRATRRRRRREEVSKQKMRDSIELFAFGKGFEKF